MHFPFLRITSREQTDLRENSDFLSSSLSLDSNQSSDLSSSNGITRDQYYKSDMIRRLKNLRTKHSLI
jgi:hypothetical protein